ncbi:NAD(P)-binding protein [Patellaria atrata CBS 101060]|uniref:NAD(P)-binding protein n=1 Tax=Patellaria atrata CBS 101060 TaxID=1346257 RepID=A0A9P4S744_9PEZI|nr:NAD(P)-binding protein [Patellaria atrata CBS 101060]
MNDLNMDQGVFKGKYVLVTGAASGIGQATAIKLASAGAHILICDVNRGGLYETVKRCYRNKEEDDDDDDDQEIVETYLDVSFTEDVVETVKSLMSKAQRRIDFVVNCAGINPTSYDLVDTTEEYWDKLMNTNLKGIYNVTKACIPHMPPGGAFVNVSSIAGLHPSARQAIYCATKYGVIGFSKAMALELGPKGIRTNVVAPGYINTPTNAGVVKGGDFIKRMENGTALGRMGTPEEVADVIAFLLREESKYMNGSVLEIDGGLKT